MISQSIRDQSYTYVEKRGFRPAKWLPIQREAVVDLRPIKEIAARLMALDCLFTWVSATEAQVASPRIINYRDRNGLTGFLTSEENCQLATDRKAANQQFPDSIGWKLENMWPLAWVLGFDPMPDIDTGMIPAEITRPMIMEFMPGLNTTIDDLCTKAKPRTSEEVMLLEDRFYVAHNAVRAAQLGGTNVPGGFHPLRDGGTVHERRHSLTWCVSPPVSWDDADLST